MNVDTMLSTAEDYCAQGDSEAKAGNFADAIKQFQHALALNPDYITAHYNLGRVLLVLGQRNQTPEHFALALKHLEKALSLDPDFTKALVSKATALAFTGQIDEAINAFQNALKQDPESLEAHHWLGEIYSKTGQREEGAHHYRQFLEKEPDNLEVRRKIGSLLILEGKFLSALPALNEAKEHFSYILTKHPDDVPALISMGTCHLMAFEHEQSVACFQHAIVADPNCSEAYYWLAVLSSNSRDQEKALEYVRKSIALNPDFSGAYVLLAMTLEQMNRMSEVEDITRYAVRRWPEDARLSIPLGRIAKRNGDIPKAKECFERALTEMNEQFGVETICNDLARIYEELKDYDKAFEFYSRAQEISAQNILYKHRNPQHFGFVLQTMRRWFERSKPEEFPEPYIPAKGEHAAPVFFVGFPRSGTTLVEQILHSHPDIVTAQEELWIGDIAMRIKELTGPQSTYPGGIFQLNNKQIRQLRDEYWRLVEKTIPPEKLKGKLLVDKLPLNLPHLPFIHRIFPDAKIIVAIRDPRDVIWSCFIQIFLPSDVMANFNSLESTAAIYTNLMDLYLRYRKKLDMPILQYRYEDLVGDIESHARHMLDFIGLPWDDNVLRYHEEKNRRNISTPSYEGVAQPIYTTSMQRWKRFGKYMAPFLPALNPLIEALGYTPETIAMEPAMKPYWISSYCHLADSFAKQEYFDEALEYFHKALELDPTCEAAHINTGRILLLRGQSQNDAAIISQSIPHFMNVLEHNPDNPDANLYLGKAYELTGNAPEAKKYLIQAVALNPNSPEAFLFLAQAHDMFGELKKTVDALDHALALHPDWIEALSYKAVILERMNLPVGSSRVDLQACKLEYSIVSPK